MTLLIRDALLDGAPHTIRIAEGRIAAIEPGGGPEEAPRRDSSERVIDARGLHAFPSLKNGHTHVAMVLFRGYGDDMPLMEWLETRIWPAEAKLGEEEVYLGARLGILEMIRSGTTFFNEMYWFRGGIVRAVEEMGVRALIGSAIIDVGQPGMLEAQQEEVLRTIEGLEAEGMSGRVGFSVAPHSIYTVPEEALRWCGEVAREHDLYVHTHLSETGEEVERCVEAHGCRPAELLERVGLLGPRLIAAHGQYLDGAELRLLGGAGATVVTNPLANLKLATGGIFPYRAARAAGVRTCLGTDGAASNNNLDLFEEIKMVALLQKHRERDATVLPAAEALGLATTAPAEAFGLGSGTLAVGEPADLILVELGAPSTQPVHDPVSALVYAANGSAVHTTICAGEVLMHDRVVEVCDEEEVVARAVEVAERVVR